MKPSTQRGAWISRDPAARNVTGTLPNLWRQTEPKASAGGALTSAAQEAIQTAESLAHARLLELVEHATARTRAAEAEAERWRAHALATEADARQRGFAAGEQAGLVAGEAAARAAAQATIERLATLGERATVDLRAALDEQRDQLANLALEIARQVIGEAFHAEPALLVNRVGLLLSQIGESAAATVRLHPADAPLVRTQWGALAEANGWHAHKPHFVADPAVEAGGCVIEARAHYLDAQPAALLALVRDAFARHAAAAAARQIAEAGGAA